MQRLVLAFGMIALAACDSGSVPPPGQEPLRPSAIEVAEDEVVLRGGGLIVGSEAFYFAAGENEVRGALARVLGKADSDAANDECGAGPMSLVGYPGDLTVNFQNGSLVGWTLMGAGDAISVEGDVQVGTSREEAEAANGFAPFADSTLGEEFSLGDRLGGFIEDDAVAMLYAGRQCFFR